jgi:hypothetical protein
VWEDRKGSRTGRSRCAAVALPENLKLLVVLDKEAVRGDVVACNNHAVGRGVVLPADAGAMVGAPDPGVVDEDIAGVDGEAHLRSADPGAADVEEDVGEQCRVAGVTGLAPLGPGFEERRRFSLGRVEEEAFDGDAVDIGDLHRGRALDGLEGREAETHHYRIGSGDFDG